jgi:hypothetical protein
MADGWRTCNPIDPAVHLRGTRLLYETGPPCRLASAA